MIETTDTPKVGEIRRGNGGKYIWRVCPDCQKEQWVRFVRGAPVGKRCKNCANSLRGNRARNWKGGRQLTIRGYFRVKLLPDDPFYPMTGHTGNVYEHRLVVARALGRLLLTEELVHHKGDRYPIESIENRQDNRYPENLKIVSRAENGRRRGA